MSSSGYNNKPYASSNYAGGNAGTGSYNQNGNSYGNSGSSSSSYTQRNGY